MCWNCSCVCVASDKCAVLLKLVKGFAEDGRKIVVFTRWNDTLEYIRKMFRNAQVSVTTIVSSTSGPDRAERIQFWQRSRTNNVLLGHSRIMGNGLNLQAGSVVIITELNWDPFDDVQAASRFVFSQNVL